MEVWGDGVHVWRCGGDGVHVWRLIRFTTFNVLCLLCR